MKLDSNLDVRIRIYNGKSRPFTATGNYTTQVTRQTDKVIDVVHELSWEINARVINNSPHSLLHLQKQTQ